MGTGVFYLILGVAGLYIGDEFLVKGAAGIARGFNIRPAFVEFTLVAFGISAPELTVICLVSARSAGSLALGNIIGSDIANIGLVIVIVALVHPISVERAIIKRLERSVTPKTEDGFVTSAS